MSQRPFLLLSTRPEDEIAAEELDSFARAMRIPSGAIEQRRVESAPLGKDCLDNYSGLILGGSPFNSTDLAKSQLQLRVEREIGTLVAKAIERDFPLMGACYGIGAIGTVVGATWGNEFAEDAGAASCPSRRQARQTRSSTGSRPLLPASSGTKKQSPPCPTQMFRVKTNIYATQFNPELNAESLELRLMVYADREYFAPAEFDAIMAAAFDADYTHNNRVMENFARRYSRS